MSSSTRSMVLGAIVALYVIWSLRMVDMQAVKLAIVSALVPFFFLLSTVPLTLFKDTTLLDHSLGSETQQEVHTPETPTISSLTTTSEDATGIPSQPASDRPLILYAYAESESARENLAFFVAHGLHGAADFVFIFNGATSATTMVPKMANVRSVQRENDCYDLGAYADVLLKKDLYKSYKQFIMLNASIRGPFLPHWSKGCWSYLYLRKVTDEVKLVGMTANCYTAFHVQSMIWATDSIGLSILLFPPENALAEIAKKPIHVPSGAPFVLETASASTPDILVPTGINICFHDWSSAVRAEISSTALIEASGYKVDVMMSAYHADANYEARCDTEENGDVLNDGKYFGTNVHVFETIFMKTNRNIDPVALEKQTQWVTGSGYKSWDACGAPGEGVVADGYIQRRRTTRL